ncbi:MAG TPA: hypothetical protein VN249_10190, partial [Prolixibacteraceae bacterium]|nr:hypothetical protein [Prolixibacteraceae bacterium]
RLVTACFLLMFFNAAWSQDSVAVKKERNWSFNGYAKDMQTLIFPNAYQDFITYNLLHNRNNFKWNMSDRFTFALEERNRFYSGELSSMGPNYGDFIAYDNGLMNLSWNISSGNSCLLNVSIDRLWLDFTLKNFQATAGRQRINWSQTFVWNPNDIFNAYSYFDVDYEEKPGSDAIRLQYFTGTASKAELAVKADRDKKITAAGFYRFNKWRYDFQGLAGIYAQDDLVLGLGWAGQIAKGGFKGEMSWFRSLEHFSDSSWVFLASAEYDYTFRNSLFVQLESFYNSNKNNPSNVLISQFNPGLLNAKNPFLIGFSIFGNLSYPLTPLISLSFASIFNPSNSMYFLIPTFTWSFLDNLDLSVITQTFHSYDPEFSDASQTMLYARLKYSF